MGEWINDQIRKGYNNIDFECKCYIISIIQKFLTLKEFISQRIRAVQVSGFFIIL